ncbi:MAG: diguanylate cyclase [Rhodocyclales bacterium]|nr:diguanylate cyclase [Rhodocyclales bacterium]
MQPSTLTCASDADVVGALLPRPAPSPSGQPPPAHAGVAPLTAILITGVAIVVVEAVIMMLLEELPPLPRWAEIMFDSSALLLFVSPVLYLLAYRPQRRHVAELEQLATALERSNRELENRVLERTRAQQETNSRLDETVRRLEVQNRGIRILAEVVEVFQACHTSEEAYETIRCYAERLFPHTAGCIAIFRESRNVLEPVAHWGAFGAHDSAFAPEDCWALRRGRPHLVGDGGTTPQCGHLGDEHVDGSICVPMMAQGTTIGVLSLLPQAQAGAEREAFDPAAATALAIPVSEQIALALANLMLRETLRYQAIRDPLTGLFNRRYLEESHARELLRAKRRRLSVGIAMLDLDHFKRYNDSFGHHAGDALLAALGQLLQASLRPEDMACRYGGEEFLLVIPETPLEFMRQRMDQLREAVGRLVVEARGQRLGTVTVSIGVAVYPQHGETADDLIQEADKALYAAKAQGRNRVVLAETASRELPA